MKIVQLEQGSPEWYAWRANLATASDAPVIMGVAPSYWQTRKWSQLHERRGNPGKVEPKDEKARQMMAHGQENEARAREALLELEGTDALPACIEWEGKGYGASLDCLQVVEPDLEIPTRFVTTEIKCPVLGWGGNLMPALEACSIHKVNMKTCIPPHIWWQLVHQAAVLTSDAAAGTEFDKRLMAYIDDENYILLDLDVPLLLSDWPALDVEWTRFLSGQPQKPQGVGWGRAALTWRLAKTEYEHAKKNLDAARDALCEIGEGEGEGIVVTSRVKKGGVDYKRLAQHWYDGSPEHARGEPLADVENIYRKDDSAPYFDVRLVKEEENDAKTVTT